MTSPPRPQIITIPRRLSSLKPLRDECDSGARSILKPNFTPVTPPQSPLVALGNTVRCEEASIMDTRRRGLERNANELWVPLTPFNSPVQKPRIIRIASPKIPRKSPASLPQAISRQIFTAWTLDELEFSISSFPDVMLQLDSPVIQHLRLDFFNCLLRPVLKNPKSPSVRAPHSQFSTLSRHSIFRPLSSHPTRLCSHQSLESIKPNSKSKHHIDHVSHHTFSANPTLHALQNIFPNASIPTLDSLQATYLAHYYLSTAPLFTQAKPHSSALTAVPNPFISLLDIPPKARETLGMPTSTSNPPHRASWFKPESLVIGDDALHLRIEPLVEGLKRMVRDLLGILEGRRLGKKDEVLVRAVGEVIRLGEVEGQAANDGVED